MSKLWKKRILSTALGIVVGIAILFVCLYFFLPKTGEVEKEATKIVEKTVMVKFYPTATPTATETAMTTATPTATTTIGPNLLVLYEDLRNQTPLVAFEFGEGSSLNSTTWDYKANGLVSLIEIPKGSSATFEFEWWGPSGEWNNLVEAYKVEWGPGEYNLQEIYFPSGERNLNDTLQRVVVHHNGNITLYEHDIPPLGIEIVLN